jgi:hypothetical protein
MLYKNCSSNSVWWPQHMNPIHQGIQDNRESAVITTAFKHAVKTNRDAGAAPNNESQ